MGTLYSDTKHALYVQAFSEEYHEVLTDLLISLISLQLLCEEDLCQVVVNAVCLIGVCNLLMQFCHWYYKYMSANPCLCISFEIDFGFHLSWNTTNATITTICQNPTNAPAQYIMATHHPNVPAKTSLKLHASERRLQGSFVFWVLWDIYDTMMIKFCQNFPKGPTKSI